MPYNKLSITVFKKNPFGGAVGHNVANRPYRINLLKPTGYVMHQHI